MNLDAVVSRDFGQIAQRYSKRDTMLYALGVGFGSQPLDEAHLRYVYEADLVAVPTYANVLCHPGMWVADKALDIDWKKLLHAEQRLEIHDALPADGEVRASFRVKGVADRGSDKGAFLHLEKQLFHGDTDRPIASVISSYLLRGDGGCGDYGEAPGELSRLPGGDPDQCVEISTSEIQPLIYRLSGDYNPLHVDPKVAQAAGFPRPILHGLATKGLAAYVLLREMADLDASRLRSLSVRFTRPVLPGDTLRFEFWGSAPGSVRFRALVPEREAVVLDRCSAEIA